MLSAQSPVVSAGGVVNAASFVAPVTVGSLVSIFGSNLAPQAALATSIPLSTLLGGVAVSFNGLMAPLLYVSANQINAQLPFEVSSNSSVNVVVSNNGILSTPQTVNVSPYAPGVFAVQGYAVAIHSDGSLAAPAGSIPQVPSSPAVPGETLQILVTGLGPVNPPAITGNNSLDMLRRTVATPTVMIGGLSAQVTFSGLSPQFVGVYQLNVVVPVNASPGNFAALQIQIGGAVDAGNTTIAISTSSWPEWGQNAAHTSSVPNTGQQLNEILANIVYDPLIADESAATGDLLVHYQVPLVDGNDVFMEFKSGSFDASTYSSEAWGENHFNWQNGQLVQVWSYTSDWKAPGNSNDFWEPVFHAALANGAVYVPGASGSVIQLDRDTGNVIQRIAPFGTDPNTYETGPITVDSNGNLFYNAIQIVVDRTNGFYVNDAIDSWLVKVAADGSFSMASYKSLTAVNAPASSAACFTSFATSQLPWPPSPSAVPETNTCGTQRVALNVAPAIAPDGSIYAVTRSQFNSHYAYLIALAPDLSKKWGRRCKAVFMTAAAFRFRTGAGCLRTGLQAAAAPARLWASIPPLIEPGTALWTTVRRRRPW